MTSVQEVLKRLKAKARPDQLEGMARYGMNVDQRLGVSIPEIRKIAKELGKDHKLAIDLWKTGIAEAKILASMIGEYDKLTSNQMENWVKGIDSWDVCDQVCMNLFEKTPLAWKKVIEWSNRKEEFVKRAAYSLIACLAWHDKESEDAKFIRFFEIVKCGSNDDRNMVKKAVNWALRNIGKRNANLNKKALKIAREIQRMDSKTASWISSDAIRELQGEGVQKRLRKRK